MMKPNPQNERIKRAYFHFLREARRRHDASIDGVAKALNRFEEVTGYRDFGKFHREQAVAFKRKLDTMKAERSGQTLSRATVNSTLSALRSFFIWLADQPGYKRRINYSDADYFNLSEKEVRIARAGHTKSPPTLEQVHRVLAVMPDGSDTEKRDRALVAFTLLTAARDGALASIKLRHIDLLQQRLNHDPRDMNVKFSKSFPTWFFPVGGEALAIVEAWITHLRSNLLWGDGDPLFPATRVAVGASGGFQASGLKRDHWKTAEPIRRIFRQAFEAAGLPYHNPHSFRDTLAQLGERLCRSPEEFKAWAQNIGHEKVLTTFTSYGVVAPHRQAELIQSIGQDRRVEPGVEERLARIEAAMAGGTRTVVSADIGAGPP